MQQDIRFTTTSDGVRISYSAIGSGPPVLKVANWLSHIEHDLESPVWQHWFEDISRNHTLIRYDERGCGLSDRTADDVSMEGWIKDIEAVADAAGLETFTLLGVSKGGAVAVEYAVRHPERVDRLVLHGAFALGWKSAPPEQRAEAEALVTLTKEGWGRNNPAYRQVFTSRFMPEATMEQQDWFNELQRTSTTPEHALKCQVASGEIDVMERLKEVTAPTLVFHASDDAFVPFDQGRHIASQIPNARFVPLESRNHLILGEEEAWKRFMDEFNRFMKERVPGQKAGSRRRVGSGGYFDFSGLTDREVEVLRLIASGKSNREIAEELFITSNTVANHVKNILSKTAASNRTEAATLAVERGLL